MINISLDVHCEYNNKEIGELNFEQYDKMTVIDQCFKIKYTSLTNEIKLTITHFKEIYGTFVVDLNNFKQDKIYKFWIDVINDK